MVVLPFVYSSDTDNPVLQFGKWVTHDATTFFTFVLAVSTVALAVSTLLLWNATRRGIANQTRDTQILQRAYLSVDLAGINPYIGQSGDIVGHIDIRNAGNLPARNVRWVIKQTFSNDFELRAFGINASDSFYGNNTIPPKTIVKQATSPFSIPSETYIYVWGQVRYKDGLENERVTNFCHRYNKNLLRRGSGGAPQIDTEYGRYHEYGNDAD
jgi:hypothetical protein